MTKEIRTAKTSENEVPEMITINVPGPEDDLIPDGQYEVVVARCKEGETANGNPKLSFALEILDGDHAGQWVWANVVVTEKALKRVVNVVECLTGAPCA